LKLVLPSLAFGSPIEIAIDAAEMGKKVRMSAHGTTWHRAAALSSGRSATAIVSGERPVNISIDALRIASVIVR
jgi:hypothetical protein